MATAAAEPFCCCCCRSVSPEAQLASLFGLAPDEALVESYSCSLMQSYACAHNSLTPPMQVGLRLSG